MSAAVEVSMERPEGVLCEAPGCERRARRTGLCWGHSKQKERGQQFREPAPRPSGRERVREAAYRYAEASAEDDEEFRKADENLWKAAVAVHGHLIGELTRRALAELRTRGIKLGRPSKYPPQLVVLTVESVGRARASLLLGVSEWTIRRALKTSRNPPLCSPENPDPVP